MKTVFSISLMVLLTFLLFDRTGFKVMASENIVFTDDFNDGDISDWAVKRNIQWNNTTLPCMNGGNQAQWTAVNNNLRIDINGPACVIEIAPMNLDLSVNNAYSIEFDWHFENGTQMDRNFALLWKDPQNWIGIKILGNNLIVHKLYKGNYQIIPGSSINFPFENNRKYRFKTTYSKDNQITVSIDNQQLIDVTDSVYIEPYSGSYAFAAQASVGAIRSSTTSFDNIVVTALDDTLGVELIKQDQEPWGSLEYDSATAWASTSQGTTFKDWGCALTSAVMVLRFHGITLMPDGSAITPLSLNNWLLANNGYFDGGNVSFAAIAALTKKLSDQYGHQALEYARKNLGDEPRESAVAELAAGNPVIVQKPGHFMVADGIVPNVDDLYIKDPYFSFTKFSEHQAQQISTRIFTPSFTDVSFLAITSDPATQVHIYDSTNHLLEIFPQIEQLENPSQTENFSPPIQLIEVPKPAAGVYRIELNYPDQPSLPTLINTITTSGESTRHEIPVNEHEVLLSINADAPSQLEFIQPEGFSKLRQSIALLWQQRDIKNVSLYRILDGLAAVGEETDDQIEQRIIIKILKRVVTSHFVKKQLSSSGKNTLLQQLNELQLQLLPIASPRPTSLPQPVPTHKPRR